MGFHSRFLAGLAALLLTVSLPLAVHADEPDITVVVTADRVLTEITSIPAHVSIITEEEIRASGATNLVELLGRQTGVSFRSFSNEAQAEVDMRGFGENSQGRVLVLVDGRRQNSADMSGINWLAVPIDAIERIEIVRGSASSLYGNNALGGVINIITKTPTQPLEITTFGSFGSFLTNQQRLGVQHAGERARLRSSAEHFFTDGYRNRSAYRALNFSLGADFDATDRLTLSLGGRYANLEYELPGSLTREEFESDPTQARRTVCTEFDGDGLCTASIRVANDGDEGRENQFAVDADVVWVGSGVQAELALGYSYKAVESDTASFGSYNDRITNTVSASPGVVIDWFPADVPIRSRVGVDYQWALQDIASFSGPDRATQTNDATLGQWMLGVSASNAISATERVDVTFALRYDRSEIWADKGSAGLDERTMHQAVVFDAGVVFRPVESAKVYVKGGTLFRYPFLDEQADVNFANQFENDLNPERGFTAEVGVGLFLGRVLQAEVSAYLLQMRDEIAYVGTFGIDGRNANIDETRRLGGDLTINSEPIDQLRVSAGYSFVNAVFISGDDKGNQIPLVPNHSIDAELGVRPLTGLEFGPGITYRSSAFQGGDTANTSDKVDQYVLTDLFLRYQPTGLPGDLSLSATIKNVFDVSYAPLVFFGSYYPAPGRSFQISASYRF